jgi:dTDP-4-dehydrorhamnose 3,5-epimerase
MIFIETKLPGLFMVDLEQREDERGFFARSWCYNEFAAQGLATQLVQCNVSFNARRGTLRGMHYQAEPYPETKLARCTMGAIYDVAIDLRPDSPTFGQWMGVELTAENRRALYIPAGFAHGFQTLLDNSEVFYQMSEFYHAEAARGVRWNDPAFRISWPLTDPFLSEKDRTYPDFGTKLDPVLAERERAYPDFGTKEV